MKRIALLLLTFGLAGTAAPARADVLYGLTTSGDLVSFDSSTPGTLSGSVAVSGLGSETLRGIDFRPATGQLYGVGSGGSLFVIDTLTGSATAVASLSVSPASGAALGVDFNPVPDRLRLTSTAEDNLRVNVGTGVAAVDTALAYAATDVNVGTNPNIVGSAYINNVPGATSTTLFNIDSNLDILVTQIPPNNGALNTVGSLGFDTSDLVGFDVSGTSGRAFASLTPAAGGPSRLFEINLSTGAATDLGQIGDGNGVTLVGLSAAPVPEPASLALMAVGLGAVALRRRRK